MKLFPKNAGKRLFRAVMPKTRTGDWLVSFKEFVVTHRRLPSSRMLLNDLLFRMKTSDEILRPERTFTSDKELVKDYVAMKIGREYTVPTMDVLRSPDEVRDFSFPDNCVIKPTHLSGEVILREDGRKVSTESYEVNENTDDSLDRAQMLRWFDENLYYWTREANYRYLTPKVIVEEIAFGSTDLCELKILCYRGRPKALSVVTDRLTPSQKKHCMYTTDWDALDYTLSLKDESTPIERPDCLDEILAGAATLSQDFEHVRIDTFTNGTSYVVGEITHVTASGFVQFNPSPAFEHDFSKLLFSET